MATAPWAGTVRPLEESDAGAVAAIMCEVDDARVFSPAAWLHGKRTRPERARMLELGAVLDGEVVAVGVAGLDTSTSTPGAAWASANVTAARRRIGIGSMLLERLLDHLHEVGGTRVTSFARWSAEGERWALARGWERVLGGPLIAVDPHGVPQPSVPPGFRCAAMAEVEEPRSIYEASRVAALDEPSPTVHDDIRYDEWLNEWERPTLDRDSSSVVLEGDRVVAFTYLYVAGDRGQHGFTGTLPEYRGRGLATAAKRCALRAAAARGVTRVTTSNAEENAAMRAINRKLGFEPIGEHVIYARNL